MSKYTTEVRYICETAAGLTESKGFNSIDSIMDACVSNIFNFDFPIFDETYRTVLERKILKHYYTREIGAETVGLWKHFLSTRLNEIMPYYNKLYQSELLAFNPLYDVDLTTTHEGSGGSNSEGEAHNTRTDNLSRTGSTWDVYSDTPQGALTNVENDRYLTDARKITETGSNTGTQTNASTTSDSVTTTDEYLHHVVGKTGGTSYSKLIKDYRDTFINIDMMIIEDLADLFFNLW